MLREEVFVPVHLRRIVIRPRPGSALVVVVSYAVELVFGQEVEGHQRLREVRVRWAGWERDERCEFELEGCDFLCEDAVAAGGWCHG